MGIPRRLFLLVGFTPTVRAAIHNLFVGNLYTPASIHALEFNDETEELKLVRTQPTDSSHAWIAFDHAKKNIYAASLNEARIASYRVANPTTLELTKSIPATGACLNKTSAFIEGMSSEPYYAFSASWPAPDACGMAFSVDSNGGLASVVDSWAYANESGVHGLALTRRNGKQLIYSADTSADLVWIHQVVRSNGSVSEVGRFPMPYGGMNPRHLIVHPGGKYLYAVMEADNSITQFDLDVETGLIMQDSLRVMLIPIEADTTLYWSADVQLSLSGRYLWATARGRNATETGFISVYLLGDDGRILRRMLRVPTTGGGGTNHISPAFWSDEYAAMTDFGQGYVQIFKLDGPRDSRDGTEYTTARPVAKVDIADGGCCANAIWYS